MKLKSGLGFDELLDFKKLRLSRQTLPAIWRCCSLSVSVLPRKSSFNKKRF